MMVSVSFKLHSKTALLLIIQLYNICMGSFLLMFIPQQCDENTCTFHEVWGRTDVYQHLGMACNTLTFASFLYTYMWELKREYWCMKHLEIDMMEAVHNLDSILVFRGELSEQLGHLNRRYMHALRLTAILYSINAPYSAYLIYPHYLDTSTITCFLSFSILVLMKLYNSYTIGKESRQYNRAISAYRTHWAVFNTTTPTPWPPPFALVPQADPPPPTFHYIHPQT